MNLVEKRICVTGGAGFLGKHVVARLRACGADDVFIPRSSRYDLVTRFGVGRMYDDARPDVVIHLAAQVGGIGANIDHPGKFFYDNLMMSTQLIHEGMLRGIDKFVAIGTVCGYPKMAPVPFREEDFWDGYPEETNAPYGLAKKMMLVQSQAYRQEYGFNSIFLALTNLYGPGDDFDLHTSHVLSAMIRKCVEAVAAGRDVTLWGDGSPTREFLYVEDAADAIVTAAERYDGSDPVNVGSGVEITVKALFERIAAFTGFDSSVVWDETKPNGQPRKWLDVSRAQELFGWSSRTSLNDGIRKTVEWYVDQIEERADA